MSNTPGVTPEIPQLDPMRVQVRKHAMLNAIEEEPRRRWWRIAVPASVLAAAVVATTVLWTPTNPSAYASWTAEPRAPGPGADSVVEKCRKLIAESPTADMPDWPETPTDLTIVDQRGDLTMVLFTGPESEQSCLGSPKGIEMAGGGGSPNGRPPLGSARFRMGSLGTSDPDPGQGEPRRTLVAEVGAEVAKARVSTDDGKQVTATVDNGWMVAWWPTKAKAISVTLYNSAGEVIGTESAEIK
ncbi:hypothetical protein G7043_19775 [Lentzea sp. NEAU-D13]|uniref:Uncharacterized protein n=1 Tax=Lentzea alba TaxID=2714351 RepID=A0A7C9VQ99_9PSEU|nr:hypothetical protein [Lentzea alba]NGY61173.1 hypothetical protein [Lentzea alba]